MSRRPPRPPAPPDIQVLRNRAGHPQLLGYARVSTKGQDLTPQIEKLTSAGCCRIYCEKVSGVAAFRPAFAALLDQVRRGDSVVVVRLDRLGRRTSEVIRVLEDMQTQGVHVRDLGHGIDTQGPMGKFFCQILAALAEVERALNAERTRDGLHVARMRGRVGGRPGICSRERIAMATHLRAQGYSTYEIGDAMHISSTTVRKLLTLSEREDPRQLRLLKP